MKRRGKDEGQAREREKEPAREGRSQQSWWSRSGERDTVCGRTTTKGQDTQAKVGVMRVAKGEELVTLPRRRRNSGISSLVKEVRSRAEVGKILKKDSAAHKNCEVKDREKAHADDDMFTARKQCNENFDEMVASRIADHDAAKQGVLLERWQWLKISE